MPRTKGAKNKVYKGEFKHVICFKVTTPMFEWLKAQPQKGDYIRKLIELDMIEKGIPTKNEDIKKGG